jgi:hypothetical protein
MDDLHRVHSERAVEHGERRDTLPSPADSVAKSIPHRTPSTSSDGQDQLPAGTPYTIDAAMADAIEQITGEPFPDPYTGEHDIEYWIWTGNRLVPASPEAAERIRQQEASEEEEFRLLRERQQAHRQQRWRSFSRFTKRILSPLRHLAAPLHRFVARWEHVGS